MSSPKNNLGLRFARSWALLLSILFLIPAAFPGVAPTPSAFPGVAEGNGGSGGFLRTGYAWEDVDAGENVSFSSESTYAYDVHGRIEKAVTTSVFNYLQLTTNLATATYTYDKAGSLVGEEIDFDDSAKGTVDTRYIVTFTNLNDYQTRSVVLADFGADGTVDAITTETATFDDGQRLIRVEIEEDRDNNGTVGCPYCGNREF